MLGNLNSDASILQLADVPARQAIEEDPEDDDALNVRAILLMSVATILHREGKDPSSVLDDGEREIRKAIAMRPSYFNPHNTLAAILCWRADLVGDDAKLQTAEEEARRAIELRPNLYNAYRNLAHAEILLAARADEEHHLALAEQELDSAAKMDPAASDIVEFRLELELVRARGLVARGRSSALALEAGRKLYSKVDALQDFKGLAWEAELELTGANVDATRVREIAARAAKLAPDAIYPAKWLAALPAR
jgi:hypothetical protein